MTDDQVMQWHQRIKQAVAKEREDCANLALEAWGDVPINEDLPDDDWGYAHACQDIAESIRNRGSK